MQRTLPEVPPPLTLAIVEYNAFRHPVYIIPSVHALELYCTLFYEPTALHTYSIPIIRTPNQSISGPVQRRLTPSGETTLKSVDLAMTSPLQYGSLFTMSATYTPYPRVPHACHTRVQEPRHARRNGSAQVLNVPCAALVWYVWYSARVSTDSSVRVSGRLWRGREWRGGW
jgi:hypothetical protein